MRKELNTTRLLASLVFPLMFACGQDGTGGDNVLSVPQCDDLNQAITVKNGKMTCEKLPNGVQALQDCPKYTHALTSEKGNLTCDFRNNESQAIRDALTNLSSSEKLINDYTTRLGKLTPGPGARAVYCGRTAASTKGRIGANGAFGVAAASTLCKGIAACGGNAKMCTVYDMYYSAATGVITQADTIAKSWVYMASWQNTLAGTEPTAGLHDNCGGYTYETGDTAWRGTAVKWEQRATGEKILKFYTGPSGSGNTEGAGCAESMPIACCK